uniref:Galectin n=1 Tax=Cyprinodon variegatus TaxID=28743 RepID=A0A3Q2GG56_CYPVA
MTFVAPPGYQPVYNPRIPYLGPIYGGLREGVSIYIQGSVPEDITRLVLKALKYVPFCSRFILQHPPCSFGSWTHLHCLHCFSFRRTKIITYNTNVNGKEFFMFPHHIPVERVRAIQVAGDVSIQTINIIGGGYPGDNCLIFKTVPYYAMIPGGMCPKRTIIIRGMVPYAAKRSVLIMVSRSRDIAFHMNPRVKEGVVVRNTRIAEKWGKEERELTTNPFVEGQYFDVSNIAIPLGLLCVLMHSLISFLSDTQMSIRCGNQRFKVFVNGQHLFDFSHRISFNEIDKLEIEGEVQISYIHF